LITAPREKFPCPAISLAQPFHHDGSGALQISPIRTTIKQPTERDERPFHVAHTVHAAPIKLLNLKLNQSSYLKIDAKRSFEWRFCSDVQTLANVAAFGSLGSRPSSDSLNQDHLRGPIDLPKVAIIAAVFPAFEERQFWH